jgi:anaerobic magnesium-protoporphyrin IX monomethyl ester cyclase
VRILLIKPYQPQTLLSYSPPLGILYLVSALRRRFGEALSVHVIDAKLEHRVADDLRSDIAAADVIGLSALNCEADGAYDIARLAKVMDPAKVVVLGGPLAHRQADKVFASCGEIDWVFDGEAERSFPDAIAWHMSGQQPDGTIAGMFFRTDGGIVAPKGNDFVPDLDALPWPAWDLVDFDAYGRVQNMNGWMRGRRYATLFTSRGCPYKCSYCHDVFTKKFRWRSAEDVVAEMSLLIERYGIDEFEIIDDIFNLHKPRLKKIFALLKERHPHQRLYFCFPNGLRADILDRDVVRTLKEAGTYQITVAVETVTERLQELISKHLDLEKTRRCIDYCAEQGITVKGYFMLGFPTETPREIWNTIRYAVTSRLTLASIFVVVPQPRTPLFELAKQEGAEALARVNESHYFGGKSWYALNYRFPLKTAVVLAMIIFHLYPRRLFAIVRLMGLRATSYYLRLSGLRRVPAKVRTAHGPRNDELTLPAGAALRRGDGR